MKLELTKEQAQVLVSLLDVANKAAGLQAASSCLFFSNLIAEGLKAEHVEVKPEEAK